MLIKIRNNIQISNDKISICIFLKIVNLIKLNNEIGDLSKDIKTICRELADYTKEITEMYAEKQLLSAELDTAASIQESALRKDFEEFTRNLDVDIYASMKPAKEVGGDFYGFMMLDDDHIALYIADVSGKGVPGALFMMKCKVLIDNDFHYIKDPVKLLAEINNKICEELSKLAEKIK